MMPRGVRRVPRGWEVSDPSPALVPPALSERRGLEGAAVRDLEAPTAE